MIPISPPTQTKTEPASFARILNALVCPVCTAQSIEFESDYPSSVEPFASQRVLYCTKCGSGYVENSAAFLKDYYSRDYATLNRGDRSVEPKIYFSEEYKAKSKKITRYFARASRQIVLLNAFDAQFGSVLDYGSGPGYFLYASAAKEKYAFEPDTESLKYLKYIGATHISQLDQINNYKFDTIVASHSIEHLVSEELLTTLATLLGSLKEDGKLLIEVPHGGHSYVHLDTRQDPHTLFFSPEGIVRAVEAAGGRVLYRAAAAKSEVPVRSDRFYNPEGLFFSEVRGALTLVCEMSSDRSKSNHKITGESEAVTIANNSQAAVMEILQLDRVPELPQYGPNDAVSLEYKTPYPPVIGDLVRLYDAVRSRRVTTVLEFGSGYSTAVIAAALEQNRKEFGDAAEFQALRRNNPFEIHTLDCSLEWLNITRDRIPDYCRDRAHIHQSSVTIGTFNDRLCHYYDNMPNICPDLIYLDGPMQHDVEGNIGGLNFRHNDRTVVAADIARMEWTFLPGTLIIVDGRTNNARFLKANFQRNWSYQHDAAGDVHIFELIEEPLGDLNRKQIEFCLAHKK